MTIRDSEFDLRQPVDVGNHMRTFKFLSTGDCLQSEGSRSSPRRRFENEPANVRTFRALVDMPLVSVFAARVVRLDVH